MKKFVVRLNDESEKRLNMLKDFYNNCSDFKGISSYSYNDIIQLALRCLSEDCDLE